MSTTNMTTHLASMDTPEPLDGNFEALANAMPQIVWTANPDGWTDYYNQQWVDYTGMSIKQTQGWGWAPVLHPDDLQNCIDVWKNSVATGNPYHMEYRFKRASDGAYRWHLGKALAVRNAKGDIIKWLGTCTDIDDQKEAQAMVEKQVIQRTAQLAVANAQLVGEIEERKKMAAAQMRDSARLNNIITTQHMLAKADLNLEEFLKIVVHRMDILTPSAGSVVETLEEGFMVYKATSGIAGQYVGIRLDANNSLSGLCVKSRETLRCDDTESDSRVDLDACRRLNIRSMVVAPLFHGNEAFGVLKIIAHAPCAFAETDVQTLQLMAGLVGAAIGHQAAFDAKKKLLAQLQIASEKTQHNEHRTAAIIEGCYDAFISTDEHGIISDWNKQAQVVFGWTKDEAFGVKIEELIIPHQFRATHATRMRSFFMQQVADIKSDKRLELVGLRKNGEEIPVEMTMNAIKNNGKYEFCVFLHDITGRKRTENKLLHMAQTDPLTQLPNRAMFEDRLGHAMELCKRTKKRMALIYLDMDNFKTINDTWGHKAGDLLLVDFASRLVDSVRSADTVARIGGDEFVILMEDVSDDCDGLKITENIMKNLRAPFSVEGQPTSVTASLGGVFFKGEQASADNLIKRADRLLYAAKEAGRDQGLWENPKEI